MHRLKTSNETYINHSDSRRPFGLSGIQTYNHSHASPKKLTVLRVPTVNVDDTLGPVAWNINVNKSFTHVLSPMDGDDAVACTHDPTESLSILICSSPNHAFIVVIIPVYAVIITRQYTTNAPLPTMCS